MADRVLPDLRVISPPRCGSNYLKFLLETGAGLTCAFNAGWWKHAVIPPLIDGRYAAQNRLPTLVLVREPVDQMHAIYRFVAQGGTSFGATCDSLTAFLRNPLVMNPSHGFKLRFATPLDYWLQFYVAALTWPGPRLFVDLAALQADPTHIAGPVSDLLGRAVSVSSDHPGLSRYMGRNPDKPVDDAWRFEGIETFAQRAAISRSEVDQLTADQRAAILTADVRALYGDLRAAIDQGPVRDSCPVSILR